MKRFVRNLVFDFGIRCSVLLSSIIHIIFHSCLNSTATFSLPGSSTSQKHNTDRNKFIQSYSLRSSFQLQLFSYSKHRIKQLIIITNTYISSNKESQIRYRPTCSIPYLAVARRHCPTFQKLFEQLNFSLLYPMISA